MLIVDDTVIKLEYIHRIGYYAVIQRIGKSIYIAMKICLRHTSWEKQVAEYSVKVINKNKNFNGFYGMCIW